MIGGKSAIIIFMFMIITLGGCARDADPRSSNPTANLYEEPQKLAFADVSIRYLKIKHHKVECEGFQVSLCFLVKEQGDDEWRYFYDTIHGFNYQWGRNYEILVKTESVDYGLADISEQHTSLLDVISDSNHDADADFRYLSRYSHERIVEITPGIFSLISDKVFSCTNQSCAALRSAIAQQHHAVLVFQHPLSPTELMQLTTVACSDTASSFNSSCL